MIIITTMHNEDIIVEQTYRAPIDKVWSAITEVGQMRKWFFEEIDSFKAEEGFETNFNVHHQDKNYGHLWKIIEVQAPKKIVYNWKYEGYSGNSFVIWELSSKSGGTALKFTHQGHETFPQDNPDFTRESCYIGWDYFISLRLKNFLENEYMPMQP